MRHVVIAVASITVVVAGAFGASSDLWLALEGPPVYHPGEDLTYTVRYGNRGPDDAAPVIVEVELPEGVPSATSGISFDELAAIELSAAGTDTLGHSVRVDRNPTCDRVRLRLVGPDRPGPDPPVTVPAGAEGSFQFTVATSPWYVPSSFMVEVRSPDHLAGTIWRLGRGQCSECGQWERDCAFEWSASLALPLALADDGSAVPSQGCAALLADHSGQIVLMRKGGCDALSKGVNAAAAGAAGVLLVNDGLCERPPSGAHCVDDLSDDQLGAHPTVVPMAMLSLADGEPLAAALEQGEEVTVAAGSHRSPRLWFRGRIAHDPDTGATDPARDDNLAADDVTPPESDLWTSVEGPDAVAFGGEATFTVRYGNHGPQPATVAYVNLALPADVPAPFDQLTADQWTAIEASMAGTDSLGNVPRLFRDSSCGNLLVQLQGPGPDRPVPIRPLAPGGEGAFQITVAFPLEPPREDGLWVDAPADLAGEITTLGRGTCEDCNDIPGTCFGEPLVQFDLEGVAAAVARDATSADPSFACGPIVNDVAGRIALIRRGDCEFDTKAFNAQIAGAVAAVIVNNGWCNGVAEPDCVIPISAWWIGGNWPIVMVSQLAGEPLIAAIEAGRTVVLSLGGLPTRSAGFESTVFFSSLAGWDPNPTNDDHRLGVWDNTVIPGGPVRRGGGRLP